MMMVMMTTTMSAMTITRIFSRFCGTATIVEIPTPTTSAKRAVVRSVGEGVAETGLIMSRLALFPQQVFVLFIFFYLLFLGVLIFLHT
jgi:hypothetical protein